jgi:hypothetical protein
MKWYRRGKTEELGENVYQFFFVHHETHMNWTGREPRPTLWETGD